MRERLARFVISHPWLNNCRRFIRFWQQAPPRDYRHTRRTRAIARARPFTMIGYRPLASLWNLTRSLTVEGAIVECGSANGGSAAVMGAAAPGRTLWLFDSWQGLPEPGEHDVTADGLQRDAGWNLGHQENVRRATERLGVDASRLNMVPGWFADTLAATRRKVGPIALLHVDCDWYDSVKLVLTELYDQVVEGGGVAIDDYGHWLGCRKAVDEFFGDVRAMPRFEQVDGTIRFRKPRHQETPNQ